MASFNNDLWKTVVITKRVHLGLRFVDGKIAKVLQYIIKEEVEGKCLSHGYVKRNSVTIESFSTGLLKAASVAFDVIFSCEVCLPVHGQHLKCIVKSRTSAGLRAEVEIKDHTPSPIVVFIARDHYINKPSILSFMDDANGAEGKMIEVTVIGQRFQLNDNQIRVIAELHLDELNSVTTPDDENYAVDMSAATGGGRKRKVVVV